MTTFNINEAVEVLFTQAKSAVVSYTVPDNQLRPKMYWSNVNPLQQNGLPEKADPTRPWVFVDADFGSGFKACMSGGTSGKFRRDGMLFLAVGIPIDATDGRLYADRLAQMFLDHFEGQSFSGIRIYDADINNIGVRDGFFRIVVTIMVQYDQNRE